MEYLRPMFATRQNQTTKGNITKAYLATTCESQKREL